MPLYEYRCKACGAVSEFLSTYDSDSRPECKSCGSADLEKMISVTNIAGKHAAPENCMSCCGQSGGCDSPKRCCES